MTWSYLINGDNQWRLTLRWFEMLELEGKYFKATVETVLKDIKENMLIINKNIGNIYREIKIINQKGTKWKL